jgi:hypothetical protein
LKLLKQFLLFISCALFLPVMQEARHDAAFQGIQIHSTAQSAHQQVRLLQTDPHKHYNYRTRALNDFHEHFLYVANIRIKSHFVYIHPCYKGYKQSYISVAVTISDWRGPPAMA